MKKLTLISWLSLFTCLGFVSVPPELVLAGTYYVSPGGNAAWQNCTNINNPCGWQTAMSNAEAGDTVYFRGGTYNPGNASEWSQNAMQPSHSGIDGNPIIFKAYSGEVPFIVANQGFDGGAFGVCYRDWIVWDGFSSKAEQISTGIRKIMYIRKANHVTIRNCILEGNSINTDGQNNSCISTNYTNYLTVDNCKIYNATGPGSSENSTAFLMYSTKYLTIRNCDIFNCHVAIYEKQTNSDNQYYNNFIYDNETGIRYEPTSGSWANFVCHNNVFYNNSNNQIAIQNPYGIFDGLKIYNNTFVNPSCTGTAFALEDGGNVSNIEIYNNIVIFSNRVYRYYSNELSYANYNMFYDYGYFWINSSTGDFAWWGANTTWDDNSIISNTNFKNPGGSNVEDYKRTSYPTNGRGGSYASVMGAYITGNEVIGYSGEGGSPPSPPSSPPSSPPGFSAN